MSTHYNAFISYKHAELDNKIAVMVERGLEHYHIPHKIRKKTGIKRIERIFRDTDELPITSDLSGTIAEALKNADYLIVICSTNTCKSMWVEREIKLFLQNHTQDQILTVLADGEPVDVVPEILKNKEVIRVNDLGIEETVTIPVEPLSCDFRLPKREAFNTELPRLAAALIGCSYNELMDRQRQYKVKRLTAIFAAIMAVTLTFAGYMIYSNKKVNDSYRASLISQSKYLANESEKLLENGDKVNALHLALNALPSEEMPDRPVTTEAIRAITSATGAYDPSDISDITSIWNYEMPSVVKKMDVSKENKLLTAMDEEGNISIWDLVTEKELMTFNPTHGSLVPRNFEYLPNGNIVLAGYYFIGCVNPRTAEVVWEEYFQEEFLADDNICMTNDGNFLIALNDGVFRTYSQTDGKLINEYKLSGELTDIFNTASSIVDVTLSPDNTKLAFGFYNQDNKYGVGLYDIKTNKTIYNNLGADLITAISFPTDNDVLFAYDMDVWNSNAFEIDTYTTKIDYEKVICLDPNDFSEKWAKDFENTNVSLGIDFIYIGKSNLILYYSGDRSEVWDLVTGETIHSYVFPASIVNADYDENSNNLFYVTQNGGMATNNISDFENRDTVHTVSYFVGGVNKAVLGGGIFINQWRSNRIIHYAGDTYDKEWSAYEGGHEIDSIYNSYLDDNVAAVLSEEDGKVILNLFDPNSKAFTKKVVISDGDDHDFYFGFLGTYQGKLLLAYSIPGYGVLGLVSVDYETGEFSLDKINTYCFDYFDYLDYVEYANGKIAFVEKDDTGKTIVMIYDIASGKSDEYPIAVEEGNTKGKLFFFEKQGLAYYVGEQDYIIDIGKNEIKPISYSNTWNGTVCVSVNEDGTMLAVSDERDIVIKDIAKDDKEITIPILNVETNRPVFYKEKGSKPEILIVPYTNGRLCRYNVSTGELIGKTDFLTSTISIHDYDSKFIVDPEHSCIYMQYSSMINILDMDSFEELGFIYNTMGYHAPTDTFPCLCDEESVRHLGYYRHYTLDDLIKKAKDILRDHEMSQEQKDSYGIG